MGTRMVLAHNAQLDKPQLEDKLLVLLVAQDVFHAQYKMGLKFVHLVHLIMGIRMVLAHYAHLDKLQQECKLPARLVLTQAALLVHQQVAHKFA